MSVARCKTDKKKLEISSFDYHSTVKIEIVRQNDNAVVTLVTLAAQNQSKESNDESEEKTNKNF